jgi:hypothetical protein
MNDVRNRNIVIGILLVIILVGGYMVVNNTDALDGVFNNDTVEETEAELVCVNEGDLFDEVCAETERDAVLVALGRTPSTDTEVTVTFEGLTTSGMSNVILERFVVEEEEEPVVTPTPSPRDDSQVTQSGGEIDHSIWEFSDFPASVVPYRTTFMHEQETHIEGTEFFLGDPGVRGVLTYAESRNPSAVLIGPDTQISLTTERETVLLNEDGYMFISGAGFTMNVCNKYTLTFPDMGQYHHEWQVALRGRNFVEGVDGNCAVTFSGYQPGAVLVTRFPVAVGANGFLSAEWVQQQVDNAIGGNAGWETSTLSLFLIDINDDAYSLNWFEHNEWGLVSTNVEYPQNPR